MTGYKPTGGKGYGSIPHLPGSNFGGQRDKGVDEKAAKCFLSKTKEKADVVFVTEKLDGSNTSVLKLDGNLIPLVRAGQTAYSSRFEQHHMFAYWVGKNSEMFDKLLSDGERVVGEWMAQAHGTRYNLEGRSPFAAFDIMRGPLRASYEEFFDRCEAVGLTTVPLLHRGNALTVEDAMTMLAPHGRYGAIDDFEGAVWRIERKGVFVTIAKYVRPDHKVGQYLTCSGVNVPEIWNLKLW